MLSRYHEISPILPQSIVASGGSGVRGIRVDARVTMTSKRGDIDL